MNNDWNIALEGRLAAEESTAVDVGTFRSRSFGPKLTWWRCAEKWNKAEKGTNGAEELREGKSWRGNGCNREENEDDGGTAIGGWHVCGSGDELMDGMGTQGWSFGWR